MFLPLGLGNWPRVFPFCILILTGICIAWSYSFFPIGNQARREIDKMDYQWRKDALPIKRQLAISTCIDKFKKPKICNLLASSMREKGFSPKYLKPEEASKVKNDQDFKALISHFQIFYNTKFEKWPKYIKADSNYLAYKLLKENIEKDIINVYKKFGFVSFDKLSFFNLLKATFTHGSYGHLWGNLFFLVIFGIWVEQRAGIFFTGAVFLAGSFAGLTLNLLLRTDSVILGASAGITALMGMFFILFYKAEYQFLFVAGVYFKRLSIPLKWAFPFMYILSDITGLMAIERTNVAHLAHLVGLVVGMAGGLVLKLKKPLPEKFLFQQEVDIVSQLRQSKDSKEIWTLFKESMKWNRQNWAAVEVFLAGGRQFGVAIANDKEMRLCNSYIGSYIQQSFKTGTVKEIVRVVQLFPYQLPLTQFVESVPTAQLLRSADICAQNRIYDVAFSLYKSALPRLHDQQQIQLVYHSMTAIHNHQNQLNQRKEA